MTMRGQQIAEQLDVQRIVFDNQDLGQSASPISSLTNPGNAPLYTK
jgi:hypothetical protein